MGHELSHAGVVAIFGMVVSLIPLFVGVSYVFRPSDRLLALMWPLTLATTFAAMNTFFSALAAAGLNLPKHRTAEGYDMEWLTHGLAEAMTPMFVACGFLAMAWLCVAAGMRRHS